MMDPAHSPDADDGPGGEPDRGLRSRTPPKAPRWVTVSAIIVGIVILLAVIVKLTGLGGSHGPGLHSGASRPAPVSSLEPRVSPGGNPAAQRSWQTSYR